MQGNFWRARSKTALLAVTGLFTALTAVGAFLRIPFYPVPLTLQTLFVLLAAAMLPPRYAVLSQLLYLALGLLGLPIFANGGGLGYIFTPTFGYLAAMPVAAAVAAAWQQGKTVAISRRMMGNFVASVLILLVGTTWLYLYMRQHTQFEWHTALVSGMALFIPGAIVKSVVAAWLARRLSRMLN